MRIESWTVEKYLDGYLPVPGPAVQFLLDTYMQAYYQLERVIGRGLTTIPGETEEIAARSHELMDTHYDMPLAMFQSMLGRSMKYSMGLWENGTRGLDEAQEAMLADVCAKADIRDGQKILDIGCGFGSFAEHALRHYPNARVYGLTLSQTQADYMRAKQAETGHPLNTDRFYLIQDDFNNVHFDHTFNRIVSLGVFEHISNPSRALEKVRSFISDDGQLFLHYIVYVPFPGHTDAARQDPFMDRYIFPGGRIWSHTELARHARDFTIERQWFVNGYHYTRTLQSWLANYRAHLDGIRAESGLTERQMRLVEFYLRGCIATFNAMGGNLYGNGQYLLHPN
jgi:cyclopropane-fatty-acyl-phospholipid synthase